MGEGEGNTMGAEKLRNVEDDSGSQMDGGKGVMDT